MHKVVTSPTGVSKLPIKTASKQNKSPGFLTSSRPLRRSKELMVTYFFCGEEIPYRSMMKAHSLTLGHFKEQLSKKGNYR